MRPATAGPIMEGTGSMTPSKEEDEDEDEDDTGFMHMSVQTMPAGPSHSREGSDETVMSNRRPLERHFLPLVHVLEELRGQGIYQPLRSTVALSIVKLDSRVYQNAKVAKWKPYADLAYKAGVVELGGAEGTAWISLLPEWRGLNMDDVQ
ncbi:hypothetical protein EUX98_g305 [Antrodiella citrinella]|uniref:Uncharacterized protein n=1 Tax=Antrodiella citrinella TaxID=2447956 RepID=A0A4S4N7B8_9APHY|nr:hypothetical protein EUX98_g305 [Antrodiella citrinella]